MHQRRAQFQHGFTLIELVVAMGIFAVIAAISYGSMSQFFITRDAVQQQHERMRGLQIMMSLLEQDVRYMAARPVRDNYGDPENALVTGNSGSSGELLRFTTAQADPRDPNIFQLRRVAYALEDGKLFRLYWQVLDRDVDSEPLRRQIMDDVSQVEFTFYNWDEDAKRIKKSDGWSEEEKIPLALEMLITLDTGVQYRRFLETANGT